MATEQIFITQKELDFDSDIVTEIIDKITGQEINYYAVDIEKSKVHDLYGESLQKVFFTPIRIKCLILFEEPEVKTDQFNTDIRYSIEIYFHKRSLYETKNMKPLEGDYIKWGTVFYEIVTITQPQITWGRIENLMMYKCHCRVARQDEIGMLAEENLDVQY